MLDDASKHTQVQLETNFLLQNKHNTNFSEHTASLEEL